MMATLTNSTKVTLSTNTITKGQIRHQIATLNLTAHTRSILGRTYAQLQTDPDITRLNNNLAPLQYNQTKDLIGRTNDKIAWATTLLDLTNVLQAYEEGMKEQELEDPPTKLTSKNKHRLPSDRTSPRTRPTTKTKGRTRCHQWPDKRYTHSNKCDNNKQRTQRC